MGKYPLKPIDAKGRRIRKGDLVRIVGVPTLDKLNTKSRRVVKPVFRHIKGSCKRVRGFARYGFAEILFRIRTGVFAGLHIVEIEPDLLLVQRRGHRRSKTNRKSGAPLSRSLLVPGR